MKTLQFKCLLLTDVILNQKAQTEGPNETLDFIPGNCFLGIAASQLYKGMNATTWEIFHSGKVRFGDAHLAHGKERALKVPAAMFTPKDEDKKDVCYIYHKIPDLQAEEIKDLQLKQKRNKFYDFSTIEACEVKADVNFAIKSAYDPDTRRSKDEQMYGYESLPKGAEFYFEVEVDNDDLADGITKALVGERRIGRSRTAQYGLVKIDEEKFSNMADGPKHKNIIEVYADGRLIFLDKQGLPKFRPEPCDFGIEDPNARIIYEKSQIRTFQYSPWNFKRQCFDSDRCGIEKGSVIVIETSAAVPSEHCVGASKNEGFGKVIYNPDFLQADDNGLAKYKLKDEKNEKDGPAKAEANNSTAAHEKTPLIRFLERQKAKEKELFEIYKTVNDWVKQHGAYFKKEKFASQWGTIRSYAMAEEDNDNLAKIIVEYISKGVKKTDWEGKRAEELKNFIKNNKQHLRLALINLSAEMAKICK